MPQIAPGGGRVRRTLLKNAGETQTTNREVRMNGEVSFFELGVNDPLTARDFYVELFGWEMNPGPSGEAHGFQIQTGNVRGGLHGGEERASPYLFFKVEDIQAAAERVRALGGQAGFNEHSGPGASGTFAFCEDNQGSHFGLHQPPP
jgi:uncharacterized protein